MPRAEYNDASCDCAEPKHDTCGRSCLEGGRPIQNRARLGTMVNLLPLEESGTMVNLLPLEESDPSDVDADAGGDGVGVEKYYVTGKVDRVSAARL